MKTYSIPEGATHVVVVEGPVSFVTPAIEPEPMFGMTNNQRKESKKLPEGDEVHSEKTRLAIVGLWNRTEKNLSSQLVFRRSMFGSWRQAKGLTQEDCASLSGAYDNANSVSGVEVGTFRPNKRFVEWVASEMEVPVTDLLDLYAEVS